MDISWVHKSALDDMVIEANRLFPLETGGCLMGYWEKLYEKVIITQIIGPGPNAKHRHHYFEPDYEWQESEIASIYHASGRIYTYLGDWHTHPKGGTKLSWRDRHTLHRIATYPLARVPVPLMAILSMEISPFLNVWKFELKSFWGFLVYSKKSSLKFLYYE